MVFAISSCSKSKMESLKYIPKNATSVLEISSKGILEKLKADNYTMDSVSQALNLDSDAKALLEIYDYHKPLFTFSKNTSSIAEGNQIVSGIIVPLSSKEKLETYIKTHLADKTIATSKNFSYIQVNDNAICGWQSNILIYLNNRAGASVDQLFNLFNLKKEESLASNKDAQKALSQQGDICYFINSSQALDNLPVVGITKAADLAENTYAYGSISFNKGSIDIKSNQYLNQTMVDLIKKNPTANISGDALSSFPGKPEGLLDISFNMKQLISFLDYAGVKNTVNDYLQRIGTSLDDLSAAFTGEIAIAFSNLDLQKKDLSAMNRAIPSLPSVNFVITLPIADKGAYDKFTGALARMGFFVPYNGTLVPKVFAEPTASMSYNANNKAVALASSTNLLDSFLNNKGKIDFPQELDNKNKTSLFYVDVQSILSKLPASGSDSLQTLLVKNTFKSMEGNADNLKGNMATASLSIKFIDGRQNSLSEILKFVSALKKMSKENPAGFGDMDTNIPPPPNVDTTVK